MGLIGAAALALAVLRFIPRRDAATAPPEPVATVAANRVPDTLETEARPEPPPVPASPNGLRSGDASRVDALEGEAREREHDALVAKRIAELEELADKTDPASLEILLFAVKNQDPKIWEASLDLISQSGNRAAIPGLIEAAAQVENADQKKAIAETVEFLKLPTLTELLGRDQK